MVLSQETKDTIDALIGKVSLSDRDADGNIAPAGLAYMNFSTLPMTEDVLKEEKAPESTVLTDTAQIVEHVGVGLIAASWCGGCTKLKNILTKEGIPFINIEMGSGDANSLDIRSKLADKFHIGNVYPQMIHVADIPQENSEGIDFSLLNNDESVYNAEVILAQQFNLCATKQGEYQNAKFGTCISDFVAGYHDIQVAQYPIEII